MKNPHKQFPGKMDKVTKRTYKTTHKMGYGNLRHVKMFENFDAPIVETTKADREVAKKYGIEITDSEYDEQPIEVWTMVAAKDMKFGNWEKAMDWLVALWKSDEDAFDFFRGGLSTKDDVIIGDQEFGGSDVQDHMKLAD